MNNGIVYLIGAGPGDENLLTFKGKKCIEKADVVVYDYLANKKFLSFAKKNAEIVYVGKKGGDHTYSQWQINDLIVKKAKEGKSVARLKGGDPFIFGRGGEEAEELLAAGVKFEVVPGITAATSVAAYAGIPLTHRDFTSTVAFVTGHEDPTREETRIRWDKISTGIGTLVFFMGVKNLPNIVKNLTDNGRSKDTPVAIVRWGTTSKQKTLIGTLGTIIELSQKNDVRPPSIIIVGNVVNLREKLSWFETKPLFGKNIIVTRARAQSSDFLELLQENGANTIEFPTIETVDPDSYDDLDKAISNLEKYNWVIFTSANGVKYFLDRLKVNKKDIRDLKGIKICTIGPKTALEIEKLGVMVDVVPLEYKAESVVESLGNEDVKGKNILIPRAKIAREVLPVELAKMGANVDVVDAYKTIRPNDNTENVREMLKNKEVDMITFTSSSTVSNFVSMFDKDELMKLISGVTIGSIGPITGKTAETLGLTPDLTPKDYTIESFSEAIVNHYTS